MCTEFSDRLIYPPSQLLIAASVSLPSSVIAMRANSVSGYNRNEHRVVKLPDLTSGKKLSLLR